MVPSNREELAARCARLQSASRAQATKRAYDSDWRHFEAWAAANGLPAMPTAPETVALYLAAFAEALSPATLERRVAALVVQHRANGYNLDTKSSEIHDTLAGLRRLCATISRAKTPLITSDLAIILEALPDNLTGVRDRAMLLLGQAGAFRRSELVALDFDDLTFRADGLVIRLRDGKTATPLAPEQKGIPRSSDSAACAVAAVTAWLMRAHLSDGPLFRPIDRLGRISSQRLAGRAVARILRRAAIAAARSGGLPRAKAEAWAAQFGAHSLRSGFVTAAAGGGGAEWAIQQVTGHKRRQTMMRYLRPASAIAVARAARTGATGVSGSGPPGG